MQRSDHIINSLKYFQEILSLSRSIQWSCLKPVRNQWKFDCFLLFNFILLISNSLKFFHDTPFPLNKSLMKGLLTLFNCKVKSHPSKRKSLIISVGPFGEYKINSYSIYLDAWSEELKVTFRYLLSAILIIKIPSDKSSYISPNR